MACPRCRRVTRVGDEDYAGPEHVEQPLGQRLALHGDTADNDVRAELRITREERLLARFAEVREEQQPRAVDLAMEHQRAVVRLRKAIRFLRMEHAPGPEGRATLQRSGRLMRELKPL